jgi:hypothetical protein
MNLEANDRLEGTGAINAHSNAPLIMMNDLLQGYLRSLL